MPLALPVLSSLRLKTERCAWFVNTALHYNPHTQFRTLSPGVSDTSPGEKPLHRLRFCTFPVLSNTFSCRFPVLEPFFPQQDTLRFHSCTFLGLLSALCLYFCTFQGLSNTSRRVLVNTSGHNSRTFPIRLDTLCRMLRTF